jgi:ketosteroid isomerase-like protein
MSANETTVRAYFECLDTENWDRMRTLWQPDAELRAVGARPRTGVDEVVGYFSNLFIPWPEHEDRPVRFIEQGDAIAVDVTFNGTTADGRAVSFDAVDVFDLRDGLIARLTNWYDIAYARRVLAPPSPSGV